MPENFVLLAILGFMGYMLGALRQRPIGNHVLLLAIWAIPAILLHNVFLIPLIIGYLVGWGYVALSASRVKKG